MLISMGSISQLASCVQGAARKNIGAGAALRGRRFAPIMRVCMETMMQ